MQRLPQKLLLLLIFLPFAITSNTAKANWTLNLGYHNPVNSHLGVNFNYWGSQWNFELGIGWIDGDAQAAEDKDNNGTNEEKNHVSAAAAGDIDIKYRFLTGTFAPFVQGGFGASTWAQVGDESGADANLGGPFVGAGFFIGKPAFHVYVAGNYMITPKTTQIQGGIGFDI
ncbi:MAG: hypothetical protein EOP10_00690 [Proteobacteria bacterium]|nr:MAG: hypothetical protein EOP10_00690 [Pseudomonadota bacterium]